MFLTNLSNRNLYDADPGSTGGADGEIILSGQEDPSAGGNAGGGKSAEEIAADVEAARIAASSGGGSVDEFTDINDDTNSLVKDVLLETYSDLTTVKFNKTGDIVNAEGTLLVAKADLDTSVATLKTERTTKADEYIKALGTIAVASDDGKEVDYKIEEDGSVKDADGKVLYTAEQLRDQIMSTDDYLADPEEFTSIYDEANSMTGLELVNDAGELMIFEESAAGIASRDLHIAKQEGTRIANDQINNFFVQNPELNDAYYYLKARGNLEGFGSRTNHEGIKLDDNNEQQHVSIIVESEMMRGLTREAATKRANMFKDNDMAQEEAKAGLLYMQTQEASEKQADRDTHTANQQQIAADDKVYWQNVSNIVTNGKLLEYTIPENIRVPQPNGTIIYKTKADFYNYMRQPIQDGMTAAQVAAKDEPLETKIFNDFLRFVNNDTSYLVGQKVKQQKVSNFKQRFTKGGIPANRVVIKPPAKKSNNDDIDF